MSEQQSTFSHQQLQQQPDQQMDLQTAFARPSPLAIPELLHLITSFMKKSDIATSLCVSREWYQMFLPLLWETLELDLSIYSRSGPPLPERKKYWPLVRKLLVACPGNFKMPCANIKCQNLTHLRVWDSFVDNISNRRRLTNERSLAALINRHRLSLKVYYSNADNTARTLKALSECTKLEKLWLQNQCFDTQEDWMTWYEPLWSRVESLSWDGAILMGCKSSKNVTTNVATLSSSVKTTIIKDLELTQPLSLYFFSVQLLLILKSPELIRLRWGTSHDRDITILAKFAETVPFGKHLKDLRLSNVDLTHKGVQGMLDSLPKLTRLELQGVTMDMELFRYMEAGSLRFLTVIKVLSLTGREANSGNVVQAIMTTMPGLEEFSAEYISDRDIMRSGTQWVCTGLRKLRLAFILMDEGTQDMVLNLLSTFVNLTHLNVNVDNIRYNPFSEGDSVRNHSLKLSLSHGLDRLKTLRQMMTFKGTSSYLAEPAWAMDEAHWALEHWVHLKSVSGITATRDAQYFLNRTLGIYVY